MRLSKDDKYELMKAAIMAPDLESLRAYLVRVAAAMDDLPPGKAEIPCPRYMAPAANGHAPDVMVVREQRVADAHEQWQNGQLLT